MYTHVILQPKDAVLILSLHACSALNTDYNIKMRLNTDIMKDGMKDRKKEYWLL